MALNYITPKNFHDNLQGEKHDPDIIYKNNVSVNAIKISKDIKDAFSPHVLAEPQGTFFRYKLHQNFFSNKNNKFLEAIFSFYKHYGHYNPQSS